jgi:large subunit ribosomal protein L10
MTREEKNQFVDNLAESLTATDVLYIADTSELSAGATSDLRRNCFKKNVKLSVVKNTLLRQAIERVEEKDFSELTQVLTGPTAIMFSEVGNAPAKLIKEFRKKHERPLLKAAYIEEMCFIGDDQLTTLSEIKSREELIGDVVMLLQSPAKNVVRALQSGGNTLSGLVKSLSERE